MGIKSIISKPVALFTYKKLVRQSIDAISIQNKIFKKLIKKAENTLFGKEHNFNLISDYEQFKQNVPIREYEQYTKYIDKIKQGQKDILWKGIPIYFSKTSGTTSGVKYIPITKDSMAHHIHAAKNTLLCYIYKTGKSKFVDGKMIFLQGNPTLDTFENIPIGRLSGIVAHYVPKYLQKNRMPSWEVNCIEDWETKIEKIIDETLKEDMRLISGIPSWVQMYFERILARTNKNNIMEVFPNLSLFVHGGVNFEPYKLIFRKLIGKNIPTLETYPSSEGFIAYQDDVYQKGLLLNLQAGIFYEFIPESQFFDKNRQRLMLDQIELNKNYAIILNTNAGLFGYCIGDTVKFVSKNPYKIVVTGRIKHFISAFGEHVISEEIEKAISQTQEIFQIQVKEFHVAPQIQPDSGLPYHEWFIEFENFPFNIDKFSLKIDEIMQTLNPYYKDLIQGNILKPIEITMIQKNGFINMMKKIGKLGGQNKIPKLANNREIANELINWKI